MTGLLKADWLMVAIFKGIQSSLGIHLQIGITMEYNKFLAQFMTKCYLNVTLLLWMTTFQTLHTAFQISSDSIQSTMNLFDI